MYDLICFEQGLMRNFVSTLHASYTLVAKIKPTKQPAKVTSDQLNGSLGNVQFLLSSPNELDIKLWLRTSSLNQNFMYFMRSWTFRYLKILFLFEVIQLDISIQI